MNCCKRLEFESIRGGAKKESVLVVDDKFYKNMLVKYDPNGPTLMKSLDIVKRYIIREKLIIVGGMAIDFALRLRGSKLYSEEEVPDYDFITPHHWIDAYEIAQWINRVGVNDISVINATHPTTLRVRISFTAVADCTYVPKNIFEQIPRLNYHGFDFVHPFYQYIDQHRSLTYGYEHIDMDRPVIKSRWFKDMKRYDLLWDKYPLKWTSAERPNIQLDVEKVLPGEIVNGQCVSGFLALQYWINWAGKHGFLTTWKMGNCEVSKTGIIYTIPIDSHGVSLYSNAVKPLYDQIRKKYKIKEERFYERYLDKLPRKIILDNTWELLDNTNEWLAAHPHGDFYVANLQPIMLYMLINYILLNKMKGEDRGYTFYAGYMVCRELLRFGADNNLSELLPTDEYYGKDNLTDSYLLALAKFQSKNKTNDAIDIPRQPHHVYDRDLRQRKVPEAYYKFNPAESELFQMSGEQTKKWI